MLCSLPDVIGLLDRILTPESGLLLRDPFFDLCFAITMLIYSTTRRIRSGRELFTVEKIIFLRKPRGGDDNKEGVGIKSTRGNLAEYYESGSGRQRCLRLGNYCWWILWVSYVAGLFS